MEKAKADAANSAANPSDAAIALPRLPTAMPATEANPERRPCATLRARMSNPPGAGVTANTKLANKKTSSNDNGGKSSIAMRETIHR